MTEKKRQKLKYNHIIIASLTAGYNFFINLILYTMEEIKNIHFKGYDKTAFKTENVLYKNCIIEGQNLDYKTIKNVCFDSCLIQNNSFNAGLLENVQFKNKCSLHGNTADNTIFENVLFDRAGLVNNNIRLSQFDKCTFKKTYVLFDSFNNAEESKFYNCRGLKLDRKFVSFWNITIT